MKAIPQRSIVTVDLHEAMDLHQKRWIFINCDEGGSRGQFVMIYMAKPIR
jgi:hypothetical protein